MAAAGRAPGMSVYRFWWCFRRRRDSQRGALLALQVCYLSPNMTSAQPVAQGSCAHGAWAVAFQRGGVHNSGCVGRRLGDHEHLKSAALYSPKDYPKPDGKITFDLSTSLFRSVHPLACNPPSALGPPNATCIAVYTAIPGAL